MIGARRLLRDERAASAAEFALVLPLFILLLLGIIDAGRLMWEINTIKKATQVGARMAVVTGPVDAGISDYSYVGHDPGTGIIITQGDVVPASVLGEDVCDDTQCTCTGCDWTVDYDADAFGAIVARMNAHFARITEDNVTVTYRGSGLGFAGDPTGPDISPSIEVAVSGVSFQPATSLLFATVTLPTIRTSMTAEDQAGVEAY